MHKQVHAANSFSSTIVFFNIHERSITIHERFLYHPRTFSLPYTVVFLFVSFWNNFVNKII